MSAHKNALVGRKTNSEFKQRTKASEPLRRDYEGYNAGSQKQSNLASSAFGPGFAARPATANTAKKDGTSGVSRSFTVAGQAGTKAAKQSMLASSNDLITTSETPSGPSNVRVIDL